MPQNDFKFRSVFSHKQQSIAGYVFIDLPIITDLYGIAINNVYESYFYWYTLVVVIVWCSMNWYPAVFVGQCCCCGLFIWLNCGQTDGHI